VLFTEHHVALQAEQILHKLPGRHERFIRPALRFS